MILAALLLVAVAAVILPAGLVIGAAAATSAAAAGLADTAALAAIGAAGVDCSRAESVLPADARLTLCLPEPQGRTVVVGVALDLPPPAARLAGALGASTAVERHARAGLVAVSGPAGAERP